MGMNASLNAAAILVALFLTIGLIIGYTIMNRLHSETATIMAPFGNSGIPDFYDDYKAYMLDAWQFFLYLSIGLIFMSSFINTGDIQNYILTAIASILACVVLSHIGGLIWNNISTNPMLDFTDFPPESLWFVSNLQNIFIVNVICGLMSFVFNRKGIEQVVYA